MKNQAHREQHPELGLWQQPSITFTTVRIPQPDGSVLFKRGPAIETPPEISTAEFSRRTGISQSYIGTLCREGQIQCRKKSPKKTARYMIPLSEVARYLELSGE